MATPYATYEQVIDAFRQWSPTADITQTQIEGLIVEESVNIDRYLQTNYKLPIVSPDALILLRTYCVAIVRHRMANILFNYSDINDVISANVYDFTAEAMNAKQELEGIKSGTKQLPDDVVRTGYYHGTGTADIDECLLPDYSKL